MSKNNIENFNNTKINIDIFNKKFINIKYGLLLLIIILLILFFIFCFMNFFDLIYSFLKIKDFKFRLSDNTPVKYNILTYIFIAFFISIAISYTIYITKNFNNYFDSVILNFKNREFINDYSNNSNNNSNNISIIILSILFIITIIFFNMFFYRLINIYKSMNNIKIIK